LSRGEGLRQAYTLHMGIGNARRSRRIIRTPSAIPKLCWMHANCREGTHPCASYIYGVCRDASANFNDRFSPVEIFDHRESANDERAIETPSRSSLEFEWIFTLLRVLVLWDLINESSQARLSMRENSTASLPERARCQNSSRACTSSVDIKLSLAIFQHPVHSCFSSMHEDMTW